MVVFLVSCHTRLITVQQNEVFQKQLEVANAKINKLQAENDLLLDSMLINEEGLYNRFFPVSHPQDRFSGPPPEMHRRSPPIPRHAVPENLRRSRRLSNAVQPMNGGQNISPLPSNGRREHHPDSTGPKHIQSQHQFERPLEFISHDSNGRQ
ncbi:hypothetical protein CC2G_012063 [Coprinopsis cinerea AmutBmut pab1-1]|nr:hypothetical protein CC2G_012063 [Coprinopsis cinerea AmutBmut pab1-1]